LGVQPDTAAGQTYHVIPHPGDLTHVEGSLTMAEGKSVTVDYDVDKSCQTFSMRVDASTLTGSMGTIGVPKLGATHAMLINGAPAWDGKSFTAVAGVQGATEDARYVYFNGVAPGVNTFSFTDGKSCAPAPEAWQFRVDENGTCTFTGTQRVRFGKRGHYEYTIATGSTPCDTATFTDPLPNVPKSCQISAELYTACATEGQTCTFVGTKEVRYGANGQWLTRTATGSTPCNAAVFGDPLPNVVKRCEVRDPP
jgi:hypothetical protein